MNAQSIFTSFATENSFDLNGLDKLIADLRGLAKDKRAEMKDVLAKQKEADKEALAEVGKDFYTKLNVGDTFEIKIGGKATLVKKIATKSKTVGSAACAIVEWVDDGSMGKTPNRYLGFDKVIVPVQEEIEEPDVE